MAVIYNNGTVRAEKYPEPEKIYFRGENINKDWWDWYKLKSANIAEADKPYWEIDCDIEGERNRLRELQADKTRWFTQDEFVRLQKLSAIIFDEPTEVTIDRIENNKAVIV